MNPTGAELNDMLHQLRHSQRNRARLISTLAVAAERHDMYDLADLARRMLVNCEQDVAAISDYLEGR